MVLGRWDSRSGYWDWLSVCTVASWYFDIITTICDYIDIWCLTIKYPFVEETERKTGGSKRTIVSKKTM
ncbi:unnamed protein product [Penicillium nalgiovense]|nr:unnamed protein product [Penicillium nalgiovense]